MESLPRYVQYEAGSALHVYNEAAFRYFLAVDRRRAERAIRPLLLALVSIRDERARITALTDPTAAAIFRSLGECVRENDCVGWYREGSVAGAALVQGIEPAIDARQHMSDRIVQALRSHLPADVMHGTRVRVIRLGASK
jgi:hypothetical protein